MNYKKISLIVFALILLVGTAVFFLTPKYKYAFESDGVLFVSDYKNPNEYLPELSGQKTFFVSPQVSVAGNANMYMGNASNLSIVVLTSNDKNAVQLLRITDSKNELSYCKTNNGNVRTEIDLNSFDCLALLKSPEAKTVKLLIDFPNSSVEKSTVFLNENEIIVKTKEFNDVGKAVFVLLKSMYPNAETILGTVNEKVQNIS